MLLMAIVLLLFKMENKKELHEEVNKFQWSALVLFKSKHSKSNVMPQPIDLFCHTIVFAKFSMLTSFSLHFCANMEGAYTPTVFSSGARA